MLIERPQDKLPWLFVSERGQPLTPQAVNYIIREAGERESLNSKLRDELLNGEIFTTMREAQALIENWRRHYNAVRPHSSLGYRPPRPQKRSCRQRLVCPTLRFGQPNRWPNTAGF